MRLLQRINDIRQLEEEKKAVRRGVKGSKT